MAQQLSTSFLAIFPLPTQHNPNLSVEEILTSIEFPLVEALFINACFLNNTFANFFQINEVIQSSWKLKYNILQNGNGTRSRF